MTKPINLSYSRFSTYKQCPAKYKYENIDYLVPIYKPSYFVFGSAFDEACERLFLNLKNKPSLKTIQLYFYETMLTTELNDKVINCDNTTLIRYSNGDIQPHILDQTALDNIFTKASQLEFEIFRLEDIQLFISEFQAMRKEKDVDIDNSEQLMYDYICWQSLVCKGYMILELVYNWTLANVKEVHSCQRKIMIENDHGDVYRGYLDLDVTLNNGVRYTYDIKTSSNAKKHYLEGVDNSKITMLADHHSYYDGEENNSASMSFQLAGYSQEVDNTNVGYLVFDKNIRKKDPMVRMVEVRGKITEDYLDEVFEEIDDVLHLIKDKVFDKDMDNCYMYGKCEYYNYCRGKGKAGLTTYKRKRSSESKDE